MIKCNLASLASLVNQSDPSDPFTGFSGLYLIFIKHEQKHRTKLQEGKENYQEVFFTDRRKVKCQTFHVKIYNSTSLLVCSGTC